jgi:hypothetical protein
MLITNVMTNEEYLEFRKPHKIAEKKFDALNRKMLLKYKNQIKNLKKEEQL